MNKTVRKVSDGMTVFGWIVSAFLIISNLLHLFWTFSLCIEQLKTGFGFGTNMELGVLWPWMLEICSIPVIIIAVIFLLMNIKKKASKTVFVLCIALLLGLVLQFGLTNLFIFY